MVGDPESGCSAAEVRVTLATTSAAGTWASETNEQRCGVASPAHAGMDR